MFQERREQHNDFKIAASRNGRQYLDFQNRMDNNDSCEVESNSSSANDDDEE